jgi:quercetin dioxygenase-like cupin family protein
MGAFFLAEAMLAPGTEPPGHVHSREDVLLYVLEGELDAYVGEEAFDITMGVGKKPSVACASLPKF